MVSKYQEVDIENSAGVYWTTPELFGQNTD